MKIDLVPGLPPSGGYENIVTAMDVFSRYLFAYPTSNQDTTTIAKVIINIMTKHTYLPTTLISDKRTAFTSHVNKEVADVLGITLKHATTKHAQTIGLPERSHASIKQSVKIETGERRSLWHKYISIAVLNYNLLSLEHWLWAEQSVSRPHPLHHTWFKNGYSPTENSIAKFRNCTRRPWADRSDFPRCQKKCNASLYQIQSVIW